MMSFADWLRRVDEIVMARTGLSVHDLEDCNFHNLEWDLQVMWAWLVADWYDDGITPATAAGRAIRNSV